MAIPPQAQLKPYRVVSNAELADGIIELILEPESDQVIDTFLPGQWVNVHLLNEDGSVWKKSAYSLANAPSEINDTLRIALGVKVEGEFTQRMRELKPGDHVQVQGPFGMFTLNRETPRLVGLAGGIGITPIRSMIREAIASDLPMDIILFYSCKTREGAAYHDEFRHMASENERFTYVPVFTRDERPGAVVRRIDADMLDEYIRDYMIGEYCMCGPKGFMDAMAAILHAKGAEPKQIKYERFN